MTDIVQNLLNSKNIPFKVSGQDYLIKCLNPEHEDSNPSLRVDKVSGLAHCFACGWKRNLFKHFKITGSLVPVKVAKLKQKLTEMIVYKDEVQLPEDYIPYTQPFRGISVQTLKHFGAFYTHKTDELVNRVVFPIKDIADRTVVLVGRHVQTDAEPRYKNHPRGIPIPPYPLKFDQKYTSAVLVEGIFDLLNLYDKGIHNVVCCFGTDNLRNNAGVKLLPLKAQGIEKLYIMFDGDKAGKEASKDLRPKLEELGYITEEIELPEDMDPGDLGQEWVDSIKEYIK